MRILLIGKTGQLGWELQRTLAPLGEIKAVDYPEVDLAKIESIRRLVRQVKPDLLVNAAAYTEVDRAESEPAFAQSINATAPGVLAEEAKNLEAAFIHYSTDFVFNGEKGTPYTEADQPDPINEYGRSKLAGEQIVMNVGGASMILRTSWVYSLRRPCFVTKVLEWSRKHPNLRIVTDQVGSPTWARMLAEVSAHLVAKGGSGLTDFFQSHHGIYHLAGEGSISRFDWAKMILSLDPALEEQVTQNILPAKSIDFPAPAMRPIYTALNCELFYQTFGLRLPKWDQALQLAMSN